jgi:hypothetical protein
VAHKGPPWKLADPKIPHHVISDAFTTQRYRQKCQCFLVKFVGDRISSMEKQLYVGQQKILFDREATVALYRQTIMIPGADRCRCIPCKNFAAQRGELFPRTANQNTLGCPHDQESLARMLFFVSSLAGSARSRPEFRPPQAPDYFVVSLLLRGDSHSGEGKQTRKACRWVFHFPHAARWSQIRHQSVLMFSYR